jgi:hypothetical protein
MRWFMAAQSVGFTSKRLARLWSTSSPARISAVADALSLRRG